MTPAQDQAVQQIRQLLNENFDAWVFAVRHTDENQYDQINSYYGGPLDSRWGLARLISVRADQDIINSSGPS